ncbi:MAG: stage 0 sporulation family protein [Vallitaleaceae bacterium]|jgi:cell fate regulator YaaT (PSP1 superfamily)|nr:stage 0 sporulation family protein [Vallitaleaceae bacterium]
MIKVIGVRFRKAGKVYYFNPNDLDINNSQHVIVETARGVEFGQVVHGVKEITEEEIVSPLKSVIRIATDEDLEHEEKNKLKEKEAYDVCHKKIIKHNLDMKLIDCEYTFDKNKLLFYFTADGRIDFRDLVKDLAAVFKTRIELRQIGVRDETKMVGSIGICGRPLCCSSHLSEFHPVSIKMAKEQNLSLNPSKISGVCGRLMCCLKYEEFNYRELNKSMPRVGDRIITNEDGLEGEVIHTNLLRQKAKIVVQKKDDTREIVELHTTEFTRKKAAKKVVEKVPEAELKELKRLEQLEVKEKNMKRE